MAIDLDREELVPLSVATKFFPRREDGKRRHVASVYRYTTSGCRGVILESVQCGSIRCTTQSAVLRFFSALTKARGLTSIGHETVKESQQREENRKADALGL